VGRHAVRGARAVGWRHAACAALCTLLLCGVAQAKERVVLLPDEDGKVGKLEVTTGSGRLQLMEAHSSATIHFRFLAPLRRRQVLQSELDSAFGTVLRLVIGPDDPLDTLPEVIEYTLATHPQIMSLAHERQARSAFAAEARRGFRPRVNLVGGLGYEWTRSPATRTAQRAAGKPDTDYLDLTRRQVTLDVRQMLFDGWETRSEFDRRAAVADSAAYQLRARGEQLASRAADAYLDLLRASDLLALAEANLENHRTIHGRITERSAAGIGRQAELDQANARLARGESGLVDAETGMHDALTTYLTVVGDVPPEELVRPVPTRDDLPGSLDAALAQATASHPSILATEADIAAAGEQIRNARSLLWPRIELQIAARYGDDLDGISGFDQDWMAMLNFNYNLANGGADRAKVQRSLWVRERARDLRESTIREVTEATRQAWNSVHALERRLDALERGAAATRRARDAYLEQFNLGDRDLLDLLDSENELHDARRALLEGRRDYASALYRLRASMGVLVAHAAATLPDEAEPLVARGRTP
jgi:adhesin transport system outer membrane protein